MLRCSKCLSCNKFFYIDKSPWGACQKYPNDIPDEIFQNDIDSNEPTKCADYEFNPNWEK